MQLMSVLKKAKKRESVTETMTLPVGPSMKARYQRLQNMVANNEEFESLHESTRERINQLLDEVEVELGVSKSS